MMKPGMGPGGMPGVSCLKTWWKKVKIKFQNIEVIQNEYNDLFRAVCSRVCGPARYATHILKKSN